MKFNKLICTFLVVLTITIGLTGCTKEDQPDFSGYKKIAELATLECTFHNVAEIYNDGTDILFGINVGYKKAWFEYDGKVQLGIDVSKVKIDGPDASNVVSITIPKAQVLGIPDADESTFSDIYKDTGVLTQIETVDQDQALQKAQAEMRSAAEENPELMAQARKRAEALLGQYVHTIGQAHKQNYEIKFIDAE